MALVVFVLLHGYKSRCLGPKRPQSSFVWLFRWVRMKVKSNSLKLKIETNKFSPTYKKFTSCFASGKLWNFNEISSPMKSNKITTSALDPWSPPVQYWILSADPERDLSWPLHKLRRWTPYIIPGSGQRSMWTWSDHWSFMEKRTDLWELSLFRI